MKCQIQLSSNCDKDLTYGRKVSYDTGKEVVRCKYCPHPKDVAASRSPAMHTNAKNIEGSFITGQGQEVYFDTKGRKIAPENNPYIGDKHGVKYRGLDKKGKKHFQMGGSK